MIEWMDFICYNGITIVVHSNGCGIKGGNKCERGRRKAKGYRELPLSHRCLRCERKLANELQVIRFD